MKAGDIVCILFGGRVPYVLRHTDPENIYRIVGECYVNGIMNGEAIDMWREGELSKTQFVLC